MTNWFTLYLAAERYCTTHDSMYILCTHNGAQSIYSIYALYLCCIPVAEDPVVARWSSFKRLSSLDSNIPFGSSS